MSIYLKNLAENIGAASLALERALEAILEV
jgi:hypothetical protein